jgi:hypothetical protein
MVSLRKSLIGGAIATAATLGTLATSAVPASAYVVCDRWGYCWNVHHRHYHYYPAYYRGPYYDPYYDGYYGPYYGPPYYGPPYGYYGYGPSVSLGFNFGGGHRWRH